MKTYQALARKWRPRSFEEVVGQTPVLQALINSLTQNRLHHAYLFTGTRGVGKTSIARLFAKCLNCATGVTANPCGQCDPCQSIDQGRFLDLIEVDAASRTKVEDTRELLENVQYSPTQGRFKIYLIDEVHMLSNHSFNALLKTLEEPPEHVKFLLATTDPQKLPITVLSRCLQLHLKNLSAEQITTQLAHILTEEKFSFETPALEYIAHAAQGSMRDALSLLDQAVGHGNGTVNTDDVKNMLGATAPELLLALLSSLLAKDAAQILNIIEQLAVSGVDFNHVLQEFLSLLHQIMLLQAVPALADTPAPLRKEAATLAANLGAQDVQLYYQIGLIGRRDLPLAPTPRSGFEMVLLRMLAFHPEQSVLDRPASTATVQAKPIPTPAPSVQPKTPVAPAVSPAIDKPVVTETTTTVTLPQQTTAKAGVESWSDLLPRLNINGTALIVATHCACTKQTEDSIELVIDKDHVAMLNKTIEERIAAALQAYFGRQIKLSISSGRPITETPMQTDKRKTAEAQSDAEASIEQDDYLNALMDAFDAQILPNSVKANKS
jgi:DNA polymerase-3 subunit gamma/tau